MFYAFEYFVFLNNFTGTNLYINNISDEYLKEIKELFSERYKFNVKLLDFIIPIKSIRAYTLINLHIIKALFLDLRSFDNLHPFLKADYVVYSNDVQTFKNKRAVFFGYYDYQNFDIKEKLKFNFDIFRAVVPSKSNTAFVSAVFLGLGLVSATACVLIVNDTNNSKAGSMKWGNDGFITALINFMGLSITEK